MRKAAHIVKWLGLASLLVGAWLTFVYLDSITNPERMRKLDIGAGLFVGG